MYAIGLPLGKNLTLGIVGSTMLHVAGSLAWEYLELRESESRARYSQSSVIPGGAQKCLRLWRLRTAVASNESAIRARWFSVGSSDSVQPARDADSKGLARVPNVAIRGERRKADAVGSVSEAHETRGRSRAPAGGRGIRSSVRRPLGRCVVRGGAGRPMASRRWLARGRPSPRELP